MSTQRLPPQACDRRDRGRRMEGGACVDGQHARRGSWFRRRFRQLHGPGYAAWVTRLVGADRAPALLAAYPADKYSGPYALPYLIGDFITDSGTPFAVASVAMCRRGVEAALLARGAARPRGRAGERTPGPAAQPRCCARMPEPCLTTIKATLANVRNGPIADIGQSEAHFATTRRNPSVHQPIRPDVAAGSSSRSPRSTCASS